MYISTLEYMEKYSIAKHNLFYLIYQKKLKSFKKNRRIFVEDKEYIKKKAPTVTFEEAEYMLQLREEGKTLHEVANIVNRHWQTVHKHTQIRI